MENNFVENITDLSFVKNNPSLMSNILNTIHSGVLVADPNKEGYPIIYSNASFLDVTSYRKEEVIQNNLFNIILTNLDNSTKDILTDLIINKKVIKNKVLDIKENNTKKYITFSFYPIYDSNNSLLYFLFNFEDTTNEIVLKAQNEKAIKTESCFLSNISHEMKTPLNCIIGIVDLLAKVDSADIDKKYLNTLEHNTKYLLNLIETMLNLSELQSDNDNSNKSLFNINDLLNQLINDYRTKIKDKGLVFDYNYDNRIPDSLIGDSIKLKKIISALLENCLNFTNNGQIVFDIQLKNIEDNNKLYISFTINDTGIGMSKMELLNVLDSDTKPSNLAYSKHHTTLFNLALAKKLIATIDGSIDIKSDLDVGTTVNFICPFELMPETISTSDNKTKRILIVEDSEDNRFLFHSYLKKTNYILDDAENGKEACEKFKNTTYDLILMDIQMPIMDGYTATSLIRQYENQNNLPQTTIIALTAYSFKEDLDKAIDAGCNFTLMKPIKKSMLLETLNNIL